MGVKVYGLLGRKLGHSWSAPIHAALGCADYRLIELEPEELGAFLAREDIGGLNVTIPYKRDVMAYCDVLDPMAEAIGSVNTLVRRADGKLYGYNTDAAGFCFMAQRAGIGFAGKKTLVLGSGGASRTAAACAKKLGAREVVVISRSGENNYTNLGRHADAERIVNTTPVGMYPNNGAAAVDLTAFPACAGVLDLIYNPRRTALLLQAERLGIPCAGGLYMLVAQAKRSCEVFTDTVIDDAEILRIHRLLRQAEIKQCQRQRQVQQPGGQQRPEGNFRRADGAHLQKHRHPLHTERRTAQRAGPQPGAGGLIAAGTHFQQHGGQRRPRLWQQCPAPCRQQPEVQHKAAELEVGHGRLRDDGIQRLDRAGRFQGRCAPACAAALHTAEQCRREIPRQQLRSKKPHPQRPAAQHLLPHREDDKRWPGTNTGRQQRGCLLCRELPHIVTRYCSSMQRLR